MLDRYIRSFINRVDMARLNLQSAICNLQLHGEHPMTAANDVRTHYRTCNLCEAMCGLEIKVRGQEILSIKGDRDDPFSQGHICPKAVALQDIYHDPDRLRFPVRRTAVGWEQIGWDAALDEVAANLRAVQERHDANAVGVYLGNPTVHNMGTLLFAPPFIRALRTRNRFSATSVDQLPHHFAAYHMLGHQLLLPIPDIDRTDFLLILGANPLASNGSLMSAPGVARRLRAIQERGGKMVVVDPGAPRPPPPLIGTTSSSPAPTRCCCWPCFTRSSPIGWPTPAGWLPSAMAWIRSPHRWPASRPSAWPARPGSPRPRSGAWRTILLPPPRPSAMGVWARRHRPLAG
jgi:hypothetical protein